MTSIFANYWIPKQGLHEMEDNALGQKVKASTLKHENTGSGDFMERIFCWNSSVVFHYGPLVYF